MPPLDVYAMEPMLPQSGVQQLEDLAFELTQKSAELAGTLNPAVRQALGNLVRSMNCYYSNLIEGHHTHPRDIEHALQGEYDSNPQKRNLQLEARAHIEVQQLIDHGQAPAIKPTSIFVRWVHEQFCQRLPEELLWVEHPDTGERHIVQPGLFRSIDVQVGRHIAPPAEDLPRFLERFEAAYEPSRLSRTQQIIAVAAAHHRLLWIHPFLDGNGRVARLFSHAWLQDLGIGSSLWSVSRGLARNVETYKQRLMAADSPRQGDLDGRGNLSHRELVNFCEFFLRTAIDQVDFMADLLDTKNFLVRMQHQIDEAIALKHLPKGSYELLREVWLVGEFKRGDAGRIIGMSERAGRTVLSDLLEKGYLSSEHKHAPVRLGFPADAIGRWFPALYP